MPADRAGGLRVAFFGAMSLLAREVRRHLESRGFPAGGVSLYDTGANEGSVTEFAGEAAIVQRPEESLVNESDLAFICGADDPRSAEYVEWATRGGGLAVDLSGATRSRPEVPVINCDVNPEAIGAGGRVVAAPVPTAHALSVLLHRIRRTYPMRAATATIFRPASEHGDRGIEELQQQTVSLLSFASVPTEVLGRRSAFNLFPLSLQGAPEASLEERTRTDVLRVLGVSDLPLAVRLFQAPVFHGHCYSIYVEADGAGRIEEIAGALEQSGVVSVSRGEDGRTPAELAAEPGIWVAEVTEASPRPGCFWIWAVSDAIRYGTALNAARLAEKVAEIAA